MAKQRQLVRTLSLLQVLMLGIGGTMGAGIFVLTGHAAAMVGPAIILAFLIAGLMEFTTALVYAEMASSYPIAGGGYAYVSKVRKGFLTFSVGWASWFGAIFYCALSAIGFALSLNVFLPGLPVSATAVGIVVLFAIINLRGSEEVGRTQVIVAGILLASLVGYVVLGLVLPGGFTWAKFLEEGGFFIHEDAVSNAVKVFQTIGLIYVLFVGYEVIATAAEETKNPGRIIPIAIVATFLVCMVVYSGVAFVSLGVVSADALKSFSAPLAEVASRFMGRFGAPLIGIAGLMATLSSLNTAMLSSARVALALSRDGYLPLFLSRIHPRLKTPLPAILLSAGLIAISAATAHVVFLGYISSFSWLYLTIFANLALIWLRRKFPEQKRPFKVPFYPLWPVVAAVTCVLMGIFIEPRALVFGGGLLALGLAVYQLRRPVTHMVEAVVRTVEAAHHEILVPIANPLTANSLAKMAVILGRAREDTSVAALTLVKFPRTTPLNLAQELLNREESWHKRLLKRVADYLYQQDVPVRTLLRATRSISAGILSVAEERGGVRLILMGWRGQLSTHRIAGSVVKEVIRGAKCNVAVLRDRGVDNIRRVLVPMGGGPHARLALRLAWDIAKGEVAQLTALRFVPEERRVDMGVEMDALCQAVEDVVGEATDAVTIRLMRSDSLVDGILDEVKSNSYDLIVIGASEEWFLKDMLFGSITDQIAEEAPCSVLMVRRYEPSGVSWLRRTLKRLTRANTF
jgi:amino acid transporter